MKVFKSKKPSLVGPATSTPTSTDLIPSIPACDTDVTTSAQAAAGVSVSVQLRPSLL